MPTRFIINYSDTTPYGGTYSSDYTIGETQSDGFIELLRRYSESTEADIVDAEIEEINEEINEEVNEEVLPLEVLLAIDYESIPPKFLAVTSVRSNGLSRKVRDSGHTGSFITRYIRNCPKYVYLMLLNFGTDKCVFNGDNTKAYNYIERSGLRLREW